MVARKLYTTGVHSAAIFDNARWYCRFDAVWANADGVGILCALVSLVARALIARVARVGVQVEFRSGYIGCARSVSPLRPLLVYMGEARLEYSCNNVMKHHVCFVVVFVVHALRGRVTQYKQFLYRACNKDLLIGG
jgi:hypothetical protein